MLRIVQFMIICSFLSTVLLTAQDSTNSMSRADEAYRKFEHPTALELYRKALEADPQNYQAAWKLSRAYVDVGETLDDKKERRQYYKSAEEAARQAIAIDSSGAKGHLSLSIALGRVALDAGAKERVRLSKEVKAEVDKALQLDDQDDIAWHVLGRWHRKLATLSWIEKKFANLFLGGVPKEASVETAAECFQKAIGINPGWINHHLELAITYEKLKKEDDARAEYQKVLDLPVTDSDDPAHKAYAKERLEKM